MELDKKEVLEEKIELRIPKELLQVAGHEYGIDIFNTQVLIELERVLDNNLDPLIVELPSKVEFIATSFFQGFGSSLFEFLDNYGLDRKEFTRYIELDSKSITNLNGIFREELS